MYFVKPIFYVYEPIKIANVSENGAIANDLARFIALYEKQCLMEILGACLYKELIDSFELLTGATEYTLKTDATEPIRRLVNGYEYDAPEGDNCFENSFVFDYFLFGQRFIPFGCGCGCGSDNCTKRYWKGFVQTDTFLIGTTVTTSKRSFIADYIYYHHSLINRSSTTASGQQVLTGENSTAVSNFSKRVDRYNEFIFSVLGRQGETSLYRFLFDNKDDYPTWVPNCNLRFKEKY